MKMHASITLDRILYGIEQDNDAGFCLACGDDAFDVEPDARGYICDTCEEPQVYGAEELLFLVQG